MFEEETIVEEACSKNSHNLDDGELLRLPFFDWDKAKIFYYVAKLGSFTEAGKFLNVSQSSLSRKIQILEEHLKCQLFSRVPRGVVLTPKGKELFSVIEQSFLSLKGFIYNVSIAGNNGQKRKIKISTSYAVAEYVLAEHIFFYNKIHPEIVFEVIANDHFIDLVINDIDLAIRPHASEAKGVHKEHIFTLEKKLFASAMYLEKNGKPQKVEDLANHNIIAPAIPERYPYSDLNWIFTLGMPKDKRKKPTFVSNSLECLVRAAQNGLGIIGGYEEMSIIQNSGLIRILETIKGPIAEEYIIYPNHLNDDVVFKDFIYFLLERFKNINNKNIQTNARQFINQL